MEEGPLIAFKDNASNGVDVVEFHNVVRIESLTRPRYLELNSTLTSGFEACKGKFCCFKLSLHCACEIILVDEI